MEEAHKLLKQEWYHSRSAYDVDGEFVWDGPSDWKTFSSQKPKILFLLKEAHQGYHPDNNTNKIYGIRGWNTARWTYVVQSLFKARGHTVTLPSDIELRNHFKNNFSKLAEVEIKKRNDEKSTSTDGDIEEFARNDASFLFRQIELINPQVIICCGTFSSYRIIYQNDFKENMPVLLIDGEKQSWRHKDRLVLNFYHPSYSQYPGGIPSMIALLHLVLDSGRVFDKFDWRDK